MQKKILPAVFFQKALNGPAKASTKPERLELFERELVTVTGGRGRLVLGASGSESCSVINCVRQADDCVD